MTRNIQIPSNLISELGIPQIIDITDELPKLQQRGKPEGWDGLVSPRRLEALTDIVWHHSAVFLSDNGTPEKHANNHIRAGEGGCPYHFILMGEQWYQCNDLLTFTYGVRSNNYQTVHLCVEGRYSPLRDKDTGVTIKPADELTDSQKRAMIALELTLRPLLPSYTKSNGHNYYVSTECPGYSMTRFKEEVLTFENTLNSPSKTWQSRLDKVAELANQYNYMKDLIEKGPQDGNAQWAVNQLLEVRNVLIERGLL